ncbi:hypothetical protein IAD21_06337 [Abditibacteriota bacterium]|nr:hypothetical protein IAD21_06337 [Abditibacteriota bacterium]
MPDAFSIRRAERDDAPALFELLRELALFEHLPPPDKEARARLLEDGWGERKRFDAYLAFVPEYEEPAGFCLIFETYSSFMARPRLFIEDLYVRPDFRRRGIGTGLIKWCLAQAHERGCSRVECMGLDWNSSAQDLYTKLGAHQFFEWFLFRFERRMIEHHLGVGPKRRF